MVVVVNAVLFNGFGSTSGLPAESRACTEALFVAVALRFSVTAIVMLAPGSKPLAMHCTPPVVVFAGPAQTPRLVVADTNVAPAGIGLDVTTDGAKLGPRLVTVRV